MFDELGNKIFDENRKYVMFRLEEISIIWIINNNGKLKVKFLIIVLMIKFWVIGNRIIVVFFM